MDYPYQVFNSDGELVMQAPENCRYSRNKEALLLASGYTIKLHGRKLTKTEIRKAASQ